MESVLLAFLGAVPGVLLAAWGVAGLGHLTAINLPRAHEVGLDLRVLGFALGASVLAGLVFGLAPALQSSRTNLNDALKDGARSSNRGGNQVRGALIVAEVALALVLLTGAGLLLNSFYRVSRVASGINPHNALALQFSLPEKRYPDAARRAVFFDEVLARVRQLPGVETAAATTSLPLAGWSATTSLTVNGRKEQPQAGYMCEYSFCTPDYFRAAGVPLLKGRAFGPHDRMGTPRVVVISETLAREYFRNEEPLGRRIHLEAFTGKVDDGWEIVGVVGDVRQRGLVEGARPCVYRPQVYQFGGAQGHLIVRTSGPPMALAEAVRQAARAVDSTQPLARVRSLEEIMAVSLAQRRLLLMVLGAFAAAALLLAAIGLYGVIACAVSQRSREIGIRMALGANRRNVLGLVLRDGFRLAGIGVFVGLLGAVGLTHLLAKLLYEVKPTDPLTFATVSLALLLVALLASWLPARKAARVDPIVALRQD